MRAFVYILASRRNGFLYVGVTSDIRRRLAQHYDGQVRHTRRYHIRQLVYLEPHDRISDAIQREKQLKFWKRAWKFRIIEENNPNWNDLAKQLIWLDWTCSISSPLSPPSPWRRPWLLSEANQYSRVFKTPGHFIKPTTTAVALAYARATALIGLNATDRPNASRAGAGR